MPEIFTRLIPSARAQTSTGISYWIGTVPCFSIIPFCHLKKPATSKKMQETKTDGYQKQTCTINYNNNKDFTIERLTIERLCSSPAAGLTCSLLFIFSLLYCVTPSPHMSSCTPSTAAQEMGQSDDQEEQGTLCCGMMKQFPCY